jgi:hypothetical protein
MTKIMNNHGVVIVFEDAVKYMDDDIREKLHDRLAPCTEQDFFDAYARDHEKNFGETWELEKRNPIW